MASSTPTIRAVPFVEPLEAALRLAGRRRLSFLDSAMIETNLGRWSYLATDPFGVFTVVDGQAFWNGDPMAAPPMEGLRQLLADHALSRDPDGPPFQGGAIGYIAYEAGHLFESIPPVDDGPMVQIDLAFYDSLLAFDLVERRAYAIGKDAEQLADALVGQGSKHGKTYAPRTHLWKDSRTRGEFETDVATVIHAIRAGDIFQANIAHAFTGLPESPPDPLATYRALREANPATFAALLVDDGRFIASTSPERFLRLSGRQVETRPIKGTRRRSSDPDIDRLLAQELAASVKDRAENTMIVDLLRNDLSRVCEPHSVVVPVMCGVETYASVHHLVSTVCGRLLPHLSIVDLIAATFPGGSITGAPKIKAMEIIGAVEKRRRGVYCGSIGWIGFDGDADLNIAIRTLVYDGRNFSLHAGGGITLLSDPASEYDETLAKAEKILEVFKNVS